MLFRSGIRKVKMDRALAIQSLQEVWFGFYSDDPKEALEALIKGMTKGIIGWNDMTNDQLEQELEGSVFYGENVEITVLGDTNE